MVGFNRVLYKEKAKEDIRGKWGMFALMTLMYIAVIVALEMIPFVGTIALIFVAPALQLGINMVYLRNARQQLVDFSNMFDGFQYILKAFALNFMCSLFVFLWSLLFIIPGIIAAYRYYLAFYILADNPDIGVMESIRESKRMTCGYKFDIFVMDLSFIGWAILAPLTLGILYFWLIPYRSASYMNMYLDLKGENGNQTPESSNAY